MNATHFHSHRAYFCESGFAVGEFFPPRFPCVLLVGWIASTPMIFRPFRTCGLEQNLQQHYSTFNTFSGIIALIISLLSSSIIKNFQFD